VGRGYWRRACGCCQAELARVDALLDDFTAVLRPVSRVFDARIGRAHQLPNGGPICGCLFLEGFATGGLMGRCCREDGPIRLSWGSGFCRHSVGTPGAPPTPLMKAPPPGAGAERGSAGVTEELAGPKGRPAGHAVCVPTRVRADTNRGRWGLQWPSGPFGPVGQGDRFDGPQPVGGGFKADGGANPHNREGAVIGGRRRGRARPLECRESCAAAVSSDAMRPQAAGAQYHPGELAGIAGKPSGMGLRCDGLRTAQQRRGLRTRLRLHSQGRLPNRGDNDLDTMMGRTKRCGGPDPAARLPGGDARSRASRVVRLPRCRRSGRLRIEEGWASQVEVGYQGRRSSTTARDGVILDHSSSEIGEPHGFATPPNWSPRFRQGTPRSRRGRHGTCAVTAAAATARHR